LPSSLGIVGENGSVKTRLLRLAAGIDQPVSGSVECSGAARLPGPLDALNLAPSGA
jgi:ABC-type polysaccharide/polyol phosphate transport system ATPase subunit